MKLIVLAFVLASSVGAGIFLAIRFQKPQLQPVITPTTISPTPAAGLSGEKLTGNIFLPQSITIPTSVISVKVEKYEIDETVIKNISGALGFSEQNLSSPLILDSSQYYWSSKRNFLTISKTNKTLQFGTYVQSNPEEVRGTPPTLAAALAIAEKWLIPLAPFIPDIASADSESSFYRIGGEHPEETSDVSLAQATKIDFYPKLDSSTIFGVNPKDPPLSVIVGPNNRVISANIYLGLKNIKAGDIVRTKSRQQLQEIILTEGKLVSAVEKDGDITPDATTNYSEINISNIKLGYTWQSSLSKVEPVLVLNGSATRKAGEPIDIIILVSAN